MSDHDEGKCAPRSFWESLSQTEQHKFIQAMSVESFKPGDVLFHAGDSGDCLYVLREGSVEVYVKDISGQKISLATLGKGDVFGELSLFDGGARTATVEALNDVEVFVLERKKFLKIINNNPDVASHLLTIFSERIRQTDRLLQKRVSKNSNEEIEHEFTWAQKIANKIADFSGSISFFVLNVVFFTIWIVWNVECIPFLEPFDPYPFGFLTMAVSLEAIFLSIFVLLAQNLQSAKDKIRSDIEYEVNLKAELEITYLHEKVDHMNAEIQSQLKKLLKSP